LTERERQIASHAAEGKTNQQIAEELGIGDRTVEWHLTRVYRKLRLGSRAELAAAVRARGSDASQIWADRPIGESRGAGDTDRLEEGEGS